MTDEARGAIIGAAGGGGAAAGGTITILLQGDLILGSLMAVATGCVLTGSALLYFDHRS